MAEINWKNGCWVTTIYLVNRENRVLLTWNKNMQTWIPVGGHVDPGENPEEAISREVAEETGFEFEFLQKPFFESNGNVKVLKPERIQIEKVHHHNFHINFIFFGKCTKFYDKAETDENEKLKWFSEEEILSMKDKMLENVWKSSIDAINKVKQKDPTGLEIKVKKINADAVLPRYAHPGDAGMDLFSCENYALKPGERKLFGTGLKIEIPAGYVSLIWDKSGIANKGIKTMGGVIEHTYRGEYKVILLNTSDKNYEIKMGDKIAQLLIQPVETVEILEFDELSETSRGEGGFGSTGR